MPRGGTPLLDATGRLIARAAVAPPGAAVLGKRPEDITVVTITDGEENQSREYTRDAIVAWCAEKQAQGWSFVFLGAGLDAYAEARAMGYDPRSVQAFAPDGARRPPRVHQRQRRQSLRKRDLLATGRRSTRDDFFEGDKPAEADRRHRRGEK